MSDPEVLAFLKAAKKIGIEYYLAFRLAINGMLKPRELERLKVTDLRVYRDETDPDKPCVLKVGAASVKLDCETLGAIEDYCLGRNGRIFGFRRWTLRRIFRRALQSSNVLFGVPACEYTLHTLRHTGIMLRVRCAKNMADLEAIRKDARLYSLLSLRPYLSKESTNLMDKVKFVK